MAAKSVKKEPKVKKTVVKAKPASKTVFKSEVAMKAPAKKVATKEAGVTVSVYGMDGKVSGKVTLPSEIFRAKVNPILMAQAVRVYFAGQRRGTASSKTRGEVRGTTKKVYRQKGTGRARHGAAKAPIFVGGGITFGPRPRDFSLDLPKKMKRGALFSALTSKLQENKIKVVDLGSVTGKTKEMMSLLINLELANKKGDVRSVMVVLDTASKDAMRAVRNIEGTKVKNVTNLNIYEVLQSHTILFAKNSLEVLKQTFLSEKTK